jgi:hypothetical protein
VLHFHNSFKLSNTSLLFIICYLTQNMTEKNTPDFAFGLKTIRVPIAELSPVITNAQVIGLGKEEKYEHSYFVNVSNEKYSPLVRSIEKGTNKRICRQEKWSSSSTLYFSHSRFKHTFHFWILLFHFLVTWESFFFNSDRTDTCSVVCWGECVALCENVNVLNIQSLKIEEMSTILRYIVHFFVMNRLVML